MPRTSLEASRESSRSSGRWPIRLLEASVILFALIAVFSGRSSLAFSRARGTAGYCLTPPETHVDRSQVFQVDPDTLRERMVSSNLNVLTGLNQVHRAKDEVNLSRANLLPSVNLAAIAQFAGLNFFAAGVEFLMPFLLPSNWFALHASNYQLDADKLAFKITQLNEYASVYSTYLALSNDAEMEKVLREAVDDWTHISLITDRMHAIGMDIPGAVDLAKSQQDTSELQLKQLQTLNVQHLQLLRSTLNLDPEQPVRIVETPVPPAPYEGDGVDGATSIAYSVAPELGQVRDLLVAARAGVLEAKFGFITSSALTTTAAGYIPSNFAFANDILANNFNIGFSLEPTIELARRNVDDLVIREKEIRQELDQTLSVALGQLPLQIQQYQAARSAEIHFIRNYRTKMGQYSVGQATLLDVIEARTGIVNASAARLAAETSLALSRVTLHRIFLSDEFARIQGCDYHAGQAP